MDPIFRMLYYSEIYKKDSASSHTMMTLSQNLKQVPDLSIEELAELCSTNAMTLSRLARKIGYHNFSEFRAAATESVSQYHYLNRCIPMNETDPQHPAESYLTYMEKMIHTIRKSRIFEQINVLCSLLHASTDVHYYGPPFQSVYIIMLLNDLLTDSKKIHPYTSPDNIRLDMETLSENSLLLLEPNPLSTDTDFSREILLYARKRGAKIALHVEEGDALLAFSENTDLTFPGDHTATSVINRQMVLNMLTMEYRARYIDSQEKPLW